MYFNVTFLSYTYKFKKKAILPFMMEKQKKHL